MQNLKEEADLLMQVIAAHYVSNVHGYLSQDTSFLVINIWF